MRETNSNMAPRVLEILCDVALREAFMPAAWSRGHFNGPTIKHFLNWRVTISSARPHYQVSQSRQAVKTMVA
jgi:hypothetical protein